MVPPKGVYLPISKLPTNYKNYLKYDSYHTTQTKRAFAKPLTDRANIKNLCTNEADRGVRKIKGSSNSHV